ncbi:MAG TPA: peptidyl-tRNA hydrolase [Blastocatellia bacterium]|nr:peptidyl-tRNA hydrolase [Blastocatellia bacterium]
MLVRQDLPASQQVVQACHALVELMLHNRDDPGIGKWAQLDRTIVIVVVNDENDLTRWEAELAARGVAHAHFCEPDLNNQMTAIAVHPSADRRLFRNLRLL